MRPLYSLDRDVFAEKAATLLRKTRDIDAVCKALDIRRPALRDLANDYGIPWSVYEHTSPQWPSRDDEGDGSGHWHRRWRIENHRRAQRAAREALKALPPKKRKPEPVLTYTAPEAVCYDSCVPEPPVPQALRIPRTKSETILAEVCAKHGLSKEALLGKLRHKQFVAARHEAAFRLIVEAGMTYPAVGRRMGRDHTTIMHSVKKHAATDPEAARAWAAFVAGAEQSEEAKRAEVLRLVFVDGWAISKAAEHVGVGYAHALRWLCDETERRKERKAA